MKNPNLLIWVWMVYLKWKEI